MILMNAPFRFCGVEEMDYKRSRQFYESLFFCPSTWDGGRVGTGALVDELLAVLSQIVMTR